MSDQFVQAGTGGTGSPSATDTLAGVTAGNTLIAFAFNGSTTTPVTHSCADAQGTYTEQTGTGLPATDAGNLIWANVYVLANANAGSHTVTFTSDGGGSVFVVLIEVGGPAASPVEGAPRGADQVSPGTGADALTTGALTIAQAVTLLGILNDNSSVTGSDTPAAGTSFTSRQTGNNGIIGVWRVESRGVAANTAVTGTAVTGTDDFITLGIAVKNPAGGGGGSAVPPQLGRSIYVMP